MPEALMPTPLARHGHRLAGLCLLLTLFGSGLFLWVYRANQQLFFLAGSGAGASESLGERAKALNALMYWVSLDMHAPLGARKMDQFWPEFYFQAAVLQRLGLGIVFVGIGGLLLARPLQCRRRAVIRAGFGGLSLVFAALIVLPTTWAAIRHQRTVPHMDLSRRRKIDLLHHEYFYRSGILASFELHVQPGGIQIRPDPHVNIELGFKIHPSGILGIGDAVFSPADFRGMLQQMVAEDPDVVAVVWVHADSRQRDRLRFLELAEAAGLKPANLFAAVFDDADRIEIRAIPFTELPYRNR